jgi:hypothetical protein
MPFESRCEFQRGNDARRCALPIFLAMTAWGFLGKLEKWSQAALPKI